MLLHVRATAKLVLGRTAEAFTDMMVGFRLADSVREEPLLIDHLVFISMLAVNLQTLREGLVRHAWNDAQLAEVGKHLASVDVLAGYKLAMRGERILNTSGLDWLRRQGWRSRVMEMIADDGSGIPRPGFNPWPQGWFYQNMLKISELHQNYSLAAVDERARRVFPVTSAKLDRLLEDMPPTPYTIFAKVLMPAMGNATRKSARMQFAVDAGRVACALERFRLANGNLPETLDALVPRYLDKIPPDVMDGKPLRYRRQSDGGYLIYSIGWNKSDDDGNIVWTKGKPPTVDSQQGDWVWQMPAK
jgi:hypothetical protein